jgi:uncharacterized protein YjiS (DUF1127 family)
MVAYETPYRSAAALFQVASALHAISRGARLAARRLHDWLEQRRIANDARRVLGMMSERELKDIGLTPGDVERVALGGPGSVFNSAGAHSHA